MLELTVRTGRGESVFSRRSFLQASLGMAGTLGLPTLLRQRSEAAEMGRPRRDTAVIQIWLGGGPSHLDMYDLKPAAPAENRGPYRPIQTNQTGIQICELMPRQARIMDRLAIIRSLHHGSNEHTQGIHWEQTGAIAALNDQSGDFTPTHPSVGSIVAKLRGANRRAMFPYVHIAPDPMGIPFFIKVHESAYLGALYNPFPVESARALAKPGIDAFYKLGDLISKVQFTVPNLDLLPGLDLARVHDRSHLQRQLDGLNHALNSGKSSQKFDQYQKRALELLSSEAARQAFDLEREDPRLRQGYGMNIWGQGALLCRRLVEAGVTFVTLNTDSYSGQWDNHVQIKKHLDEMLPVYDQMLTALIDDLVQRGLYERVLVVVWGEFGRSPKINEAGGRDHWGNAGFVLLGGGGLRGGAVVGSTTSRGEVPKERIVWPQDVLATIYHVLGINSGTELPDRLGRPVKILNSGEPIRELL